MFSYVRS
uniref:Uncharacterized protein n=1 Tax=Romanomermis culicivorax TaxID=13658 RepID=A0A915IKC2_ROMCU